MESVVPGTYEREKIPSAWNGYWPGEHLSHRQNKFGSAARLILIVVALCLNSSGQPLCNKSKKEIIHKMYGSQESSFVELP